MKISKLYYLILKKLFFKKLIYFIRGIKVVDFYQKKEDFIEKQYFIKKINFLYQNKFDLSFLLNNFYEKLNFYFNDLHQKMISLKIFLNKSNFDLLISNISRGLDGSILDSDIKNITYVFHMELFQNHSLKMTSYIKKILLKESSMVKVNFLRSNQKLLRVFTNT